MADRDVQIAINVLNNATQPLRQLSSDINGVSDSAKKTGESMQGLGDRLKDFREKLEAPAEASRKFALALGAGITALAGFGTMAIKAAADMEQTRIAFETMLGSAEKADTFIRDLINFAKTTPFELKGLEQAAKKLLAYGVAQQDVLPNLKMLGDIASGVGMDKLPNLILAFGQVRAAGKLTGMELRQFTETGVPLLEELSKVTGMAVSEMAGNIGNLNIPFETVQQALKNLTGEGGRFNDLMSKQAKSLGGMWSNLKDAWDIFLRNQGQALLEWGKKFTLFATDLVQNHLPAWVEKIKEVVKYLSEHKEILIIIAGAITGALIPAVIAAVASFVALFYTLAPFIAAGGAIGLLIAGIKEGKEWMIIIAGAIIGVLIPSILALVSTIWAGVIPALVAAGIAAAPWLIGGTIIGGIVAGVIWIIKHWDLVKEKTAQVWDWIKEHLTLIATILFGPAGFLAVKVGEAIAVVIGNWDLIKNTTKIIWDAIRDYFTGVWDEIKGIFESVISWITDKVNSVLNMIDKVKSAASSIVPQMNQGASFNPLSSSFQLPHFASGGFVPGPIDAPVLAVVHGGEQIIPTSRTNNNSSNSTINIYYPSFTSQNSMDDILRKIDKHLGRKSELYRMGASS